MGGEEREVEKIGRHHVDVLGSVYLAAPLSIWFFLSHIIFIS